MYKCSLSVNFNYYVFHIFNLHITKNSYLFRFSIIVSGSSYCCYKNRKYVNKMFITYGFIIHSKIISVSVIMTVQEEVLLIKRKN